MRPTQILCSLLAVATLSTAWPEVPENWKQLTHLDDVAALVKRQNHNNNDQSSSSTAQSSSGSASGSVTVSASGSQSSSGGSSSSATGKSSSGSQSGSSSGSSGSGHSSTGSSKPTGTGSGNSSTTVIDPRLGPGGVQMITPAPTAQASYYKIGDYVTFAWNYTSLSVTPSAIDILASCTANQQTYTLALNTSVAPTATFVWDTSEFQANNTQQLLTETYTLVIHDAAEGISATPQAGYLAVYNQFTFGMYLPQPYQSLVNADVCYTCSGAMTAIEKQTLTFIMGTAMVTIFSFSWFAHGAGLF